jgi:hypothetical protein
LSRFAEHNVRSSVQGSDQRSSNGSSPGLKSAMDREGGVFIGGDKRNAGIVAEISECFGVLFVIDLSI